MALSKNQRKNDIGFWGMEILWWLEAFGSLWLDNDCNDFFLEKPRKLLEKSCAILEKPQQFLENSEKISKNDKKYPLQSAVWF